MDAPILTQVQFVVFCDANLPNISLKVGDTSVSTESIGQYLKPAAKDSVILDFLKYYSAKNKTHIIFLTRDRKFCEAAGYKPHQSITIIVLQEYREVAPDASNIGNLEAATLKETIRLVFNHVINDFLNTIRPFAA